MHKPRLNKKEKELGWFTNSTAGPPCKQFPRNAKLKKKEAPYII
jgi:hypothetical protein